MNIKNFAAAIAAAAIGAGCASAPRVVKVVPVYAGATNAATEPSPYRLGQEPAKRLLEDDGWEYRAHARELQRMRLAHERQLVAIEQAAEEARLAKERGVTLQPPAAQPQAAATTVPQRQNGPTFGVLPNGAPVLLPSQPMVPVAPANGGYYQYQPVAPYGTLPNGAPVLLPSGGGGGYGGGWGGGWGSVPIAPGTFRSAVRADWGPVSRGGFLGRVGSWLAESQSGPGYRHTGGPAVITRTYGASAESFAGGGFTSGLAVRGGWRR